MPQEQIRKVPGFENVQVEDPRSSKFNHIANAVFAERDTALRAAGLDNLFCAGERAGHGGVIGAMTTGYLAGHNAARVTFGLEPLVLPRSLAVGDWIAFIGEQYATEEGRKKHFGMGRGVYWERMQKLGLYTDDESAIERRVAEAGLAGVLSRHL
jgi:folate-dependent tRNA-U54 methylase TrmFO/GidA